MLRKLLVCLLALLMVVPAGNTGATSKIEYVTVINYHSFHDSDLYPTINTKPNKFKQQLLRFKKAGYQTITAEQFLDFISGQGKLPSKPLFITIDDGFKSVYEHALPILKELGMTATLFVITSSIESGNYLGLPMCNWQELSMMEQSGAISIENHTHDFHWRYKGQLNMEAVITPITKSGQKLTKEQHQSMFFEDINLAESLIGRYLNKQPILFAYPFGAYNKDAEDILKRKGYQLIFTTEEGINLRYQSAFNIKRFNMNSNVSVHQVLKRIAKYEKKAYQSQPGNVGNITD